MDKIVSRTKYNRGEHKKFYSFHLFHRTTTLYFMLVLLVLLGALTVSNMIKNENVIFSLIMFGITCGMIPFLVVNKVNEVVKQETPERVRSTDTIEVTKHKITRANDVLTGKAVLGWDNIDAVCENDEYIYIYTADSTGLFIKKADIIEGDVESFRKIALDNLVPGKRGKSRYKRYGNVGKEYRKLMKEKKQKAKELKKKNKEKKK